MIPSFSPAYELEYDSGDWVDFSEAAKANFQEYLRQQYKSIDKVNSRWASEFKSFSDINPSRYYWNDTDNSNDKYGAGRIDWLHFRTAELKRFVDTLATLTHKSASRWLSRWARYMTSR